METLELIINAKLDGYTVEEKMHQGRKHLVAPVTMIVQGVLNGSQGPLLHLAKDFGEIPAAWDGIPVVINHPQKDGYFVSANAPDIIDSVAVGRVYNTRLENGALKAEIWLDEEKLKKVSANVLSALKLKKTIEVSIGAFTYNVQEEGTYEDVKYNAIATNHKPDHLALLPDSVGACSVEDGCGVGVNKLNNNNQNLEIMAEEKTSCTPCVKAKVDALIANEASGFKECDREMLEAFSVDQLDKLTPKTVEKVVEKVVANELSVEDKAALEFGKKMLAQRKAEMTKAIQANTAKGTWTDEILNSMSEDMLERVFNSVKKAEETVVDYSLNSNRSNINNNAEDDSKVPTLVPFISVDFSK